MTTKTTSNENENTKQKASSSANNNNNHNHNNTQNRRRRRNNHRHRKRSSPDEAISEQSSKSLLNERPQPQQDEMSGENNNNEMKMKILWWPSKKDHPYVALASEQALIPFLTKYGKKERGMFSSQKAWRIEKLQRECRKHHMTVAQALSLRRHHLKLMNPNCGLQTLRLGREADIRESAEIFERLVEQELRRQQISFLTEDEQHAAFQRTAPEGALIEATPDFLLPEPITLKRYYKESHGSKHHDGPQVKEAQVVVLEERVIHWIEVKMFFGASSIPHESKGAVGSVLKKIQKYVQLFGPGAIIFMQGCGDRLAQELNGEQVSVLDCCCPPSHNSGGVDLTPVLNHQRTWCSDSSGRILP